MPEIKPVEGRVAVRFLEDAPDQSDDRSYNKAVLALVVAAGAKVPAKKGDIVLMTESAQEFAIELDGGICLCWGGDILAIVKDDSAA